MNLFTALTGESSRMRHIQRYSSLPCLKPENVAEHSWQIAYLSYLIGTDINAKNESQPVNMGLLLSRALVHDLSECLSGDIIRSYKHGSGAELQKAMVNADRFNMHELVASFGQFSQEVYDHWLRAKEDSLEGSILSFADLACVLLFCLEERRMGNTMLEKVMDDAVKTMIAMFRSDVWLSIYLDNLVKGLKKEGLLLQYDKTT